MSMRIGGFTSKLVELFKEKDGDTRNIGTDNSSSIFDFFKGTQSNASSMNVDDLLNMNVKDGKLVSSQKTNGGSEEDLTKIINDYLDQENVIKALDSDKSGNLSKSELNAFFNTIKGNDKNLEDVSLSDVYEAAEQIENNKFELKGENKENTGAESADETKAGETEGASESEQTGEESGSTSNSGNVGNSGGLNAGGLNNGNNIGNTQLNLAAEGNYKNMTEEELNAELTDAQAGIQEGQNNLNAVLNGTNPAVASAKQNEETAYTNYQNELKTLNEDMARELDEIKMAADEKEQQVDSKKMEVSEQESTVSERQSNYDNAVSTRESLEATLASLQSAASSADEEEAAAIQAQIAAVQAQVEAAKQKEQEAKTQLDEAKTRLEELKQEQTNLEQEKTNLDQQETAKNQEIAMKYPEIQTLQQSYTDAKSNYNSVKAAEEKTANELIKHNESIRNNVQAELTTRKNEETKKENTTSLKGMYNEELGKRIADFAKNTLGSTGLCLAGVHNTLLKALGVDGFSLPFGSAYLATDYFRGEKEGYESIAQHFKEVEMPLNSDLPVGSVIIWDKGGNSSVSKLGKQHGHISIYLGTDENGNLKESSDHIGNVNTNRGTKYTVFIPV